MRDVRGLGDAPMLGGGDGGTGFSWILWAQCGWDVSRSLVFIIYDKVLLTKLAMESLKDMSVENQFLVDVAICF